MKTFASKLKPKKQPSTHRPKFNPLEHAYLHETSQFSFPDYNDPHNIAAQTEMLVSLNETERFKLDFLIDSYQGLIAGFKAQRKQFLDSMKAEFQRHLFYYSQIIASVKNHQENTRQYLKAKLEDISNIFQLKIALIETKLKNARKLLFDNDSQCVFSQKKPKIAINNPTKGLEIGKRSSYDDALDFEEELKEIYNQKNFQAEVNFIDQQELQDSLQIVKTHIITNWESRDSRSISFSSITNPEQSVDTFQEACREFEVEKGSQVFESEKQFEKTKLKLQKSPGKNHFTSSDTNTSIWEKGPFQPPILEYFHMKKKIPIQASHY